MKLHPSLQLSRLSLGDLGILWCLLEWVVGDVFQHKLDQCFGHLKNVIVIADDIMIVGKKPNHSDHDQALTTLFETARKSNVWLNYEKLQYKKQKVDFFSETYNTSSCKADKNKVTAVTKMSAVACTLWVIYHPCQVAYKWHKPVS